MKRLLKQNIIDLKMCATSDRESIIQAAITTKEIAKHIARVSSSNIWGYNINVRDRHDKTGDVYVQFKGPNGGPDDIYVYYDVPVAVYRKWVTSPSKGHFFWQNIRNAFQYSKLTGDRRGKLKNAVN